MRFLDVIGGIAEGVDETLSKSIDESNKFAREVKLRKIERRDAAEDIYQKDLREARKVMDTLSGITGGDVDKAAQLFKLGGSSAGAQNIANLINEEQLKLGDDFNLDTMIGFVETETKGFGVEDYLTKLVRRPEELISTPSEERVGGTGLYEALFKPDYSKEIQRGVEAASPFTPRKEVEGLDIQTAKLLATTASKQYEQEQEMYKLDLAAKILDNQAAREALNQKFAFTNAEFRANIDDIATYQGISLNDDGTINIQSAQEINLDLAQALTDTVEIATNVALNATGTLKDKGNLATLLAKASATDKKGGYLINANKFTEDTVPQIGKVYKISKNNKNIPHLYLGSELKFVPLF